MCPNGKLCSVFVSVSCATCRECKAVRENYACGAGERREEAHLTGDAPHLVPLVKGHCPDARLFTDIDNGLTSPRSRTHRMFKCKPPIFADLDLRAGALELPGFQTVIPTSTAGRSGRTPSMAAASTT